MSNPFSKYLPSLLLDAAEAAAWILGDPWSNLPFSPTFYTLMSDFQATPDVLPLGAAQGLH